MPLLFYVHTEVEEDPLWSVKGKGGGVGCGGLCLVLWWWFEQTKEADMNRDTTLPLPRQTACLPDRTLPVLAEFELTATELEEKLTKEDAFRHLLIRPYEDSHLPLISSANRHSPGGPVGITPQQPMAGHLLGTDAAIGPEWGDINTLRHKQWQ